MEKPGKEKGLLNVLLRTWPALPYLGLGLWLAWPLMAFSGGIWLSDIEVNGENISRLNMTSSVVFGLVCLLAALAHKKVVFLIDSRRVMLLAGCIGALGSVLIILCGPYYLSQVIGTNAAPLFYVGGVLTGVASAFMVLKCGQLYSKLPSKKVLVYVALSHVLLACVFFVVIGIPSWSPIQGGPSASGIISFVVAFPAAAFVLTLGGRAPESSQGNEGENSATYAQQRVGTGKGALASADFTAHGQQRVGTPASLKAAKPNDAYSLQRAEARAEKGAERAFSFKELPAAFWKFLVMLLLFSAAVSMMRAFVVQAYPVEETLDSTSIVMLFRLIFALIIIMVAMGRNIRRINFGKIYSSVALVLVVVIAMLPMIDVLNANLNIIISAAVTVFEIVLFCLIVYICYQRRVPSAVTIGFGYGVYMLGGVLGWMVGVSNPLAGIEPSLLPIFYLLVAGFVLVLTFILFSERDFDRLFSAINLSETTLQSVLEAADEATAASSKGEEHTQGRFLLALNDLAAKQDLSKRETEVFRYLAMGRGSDYIAKHLSISWNTVRTHTQNVYSKLGVHSRNELMNLVDALKK